MLNKVYVVTCFDIKIKDPRFKALFEDEDDAKDYLAKKKAESENDILWDLSESQVQSKVCRPDNVENGP